MKVRVGALIFVLSGLTMMAQMAPRETVSAMISGKKVAIEYGRPSLKGRSFQELTSQLPADRMWRAGSEQVTTLTTQADLTIGGEKVPAGKYSLYLHIAEDGSYSLAINRALGQPLGKIWAQAPEDMKNEPWPHFDYSAEIMDQEVARVPLHKSTSGNTDLFTITLKSNSMGAEMSIAWGDQLWTAAVTPAKAEGSDE